MSRKPCLIHSLSYFFKFWKHPWHTIILTGFSPPDHFKLITIPFLLFSSPLRQSLCHSLSLLSAFSISSPTVFSTVTTLFFFFDLFLCIRLYSVSGRLVSWLYQRSFELFACLFTNNNCPINYKYIIKIYYKFNT